MLIKGRAGAGEGLCLAMDFSSYFTRLLSFEISKAPAMVIINGIGAAVAAQVACEQNNSGEC